MAAININSNLSTIHALSFNKEFCSARYEFDEVPTDKIAAVLYSGVAPLYLQHETLLESQKNKDFDAIKSIIEQFNKLFDIMKKWCNEQKSFSEEDALSWTDMKAKFKAIVKIAEQGSENQIEANIILQALSESKKQFESICYQTKTKSSEENHIKHCIKSFILDGRVSNCLQGFLVGLRALNLHMSGINDFTKIFAGIKLEVLEQLAARFIRQNKLDIWGGDHIHYVKTFLNHIAEKYGLDKTLDQYSNDKYSDFYHEFVSYVEENFTTFFINALTNYLMVFDSDTSNYDRSKYYTKFLDSIKKDKDFTIYCLFDISEDGTEVTVKLNIRSLLRFNLVKRFALRGSFTENNIFEYIDVKVGKLILVKNRVDFSMFFDHESAAATPVFEKLYSKSEGVDSKLFDSFYNVSTELGRVLLAGFLKYAILQELYLKKSLKSYVGEIYFDFEFLKELYFLSIGNAGSELMLDEYALSRVKIKPKLGANYPEKICFKLRNYALDSAIDNNNWTQIRKLRKVVLKPDSSILGRALLFAAKNNKEDICNILIKKGATFNNWLTVKNEGVYNAIHFFVKHNNISLLRAALLNGASPNSSSSGGGSPLQLAIEMNNLEAANLLTLATDFSGNTSVVINEKETDYSLLCYAGIVKQRWNIVDHIFPRFSEKVRALFLFHICSSNNFDKSVVWLLHKPDFNVYNVDDINKGFGAIHYAIYYKRYKYLKLIIKKKYSEVDRVYIANSPTPLELALDRNDLKATKILLMNKASFFKYSQYNHIPIITAARTEGREDILNFYIRHIDWRTQKLKKLTLILCQTKEVNLMQKILAKAKNFNLNFTSGASTPLHCAIDKIDNEKMIELLVSAGADPFYQEQSDPLSGLCSPIKFAIRLQNISYIRILVKYASSLEIEFDGEEKLLLFTAENQYWRSLEYLLSLIPDDSSIEFRTSIQLNKVAEICKRYERDDLVSIIEQKSQGNRNDKSQENFKKRPTP